MSDAEVNRLSFAEGYREGLLKAIEICRSQQSVFKSVQYAVGQPMSSIKERFAIGCVIREIEEQAAMSDKSEVYWKKYVRGTHHAYRDGVCLATVQGSNMVGWRYALTSGEWSAERYGTVADAKRQAKRAISNYE